MAGRSWRRKKETGEEEEEGGGDQVTHEKERKRWNWGSRQPSAGLYTPPLDTVEPYSNPRSHQNLSKAVHAVDIGG